MPVRENFVRRISALYVAVLLILVPGYSQTATFDPQTGVPVFQLKARTVVVDVVVTDGNDQPIPGLHKEDFEVKESGVPQTITYFQEHVGAPPSDEPTPHEADVFTNVASAKTTDSVNVLLLDSLNTPLTDQAYVHTQTMKYLKNVEPGTRMAIFTLGDQLRFVQGFTADASLLSAVLNGKSVNPQTSALLRTEATKSADAVQAEQVNGAYADTNVSGHGGDPALAAAAAALVSFQAQTHAFELDMRVQQTLFALQQLALYLAGVPGRKNLIWFSGAFPVTILPDVNGSENVRTYENEIRKTDRLLAKAQVAIYPIAAEGTAPDNYNGVEHNLKGITTAEDARQDQIGGLQAEAAERNAAHQAMQQIADDTGGKAFYNTNGIKEAITHIMHNGSRYYTIAYTPTDKEMNGAYRPIRVSLRTGASYKLAYRRGYYTEDAKEQVADQKNRITDPLHPYMGHGMPDTTQIPFTLNLIPSPKQPAADAARAGDNAALKGPTTRYQATFWVPVNSLHLEASPGGDHQDSLEAALVVYDHTGKALNWMVRTVNLTLKPERYAAAQQVGIPLRVEIDAPQGDIYLRTGVYESSTHQAGTIEVPLTQVTPVVVASK